MSALIPIITKAGLAAVFSQTNAGLSAEITHIVLGDVGRTPNDSETQLVNERMRIAVADGAKVGDHQIHVTGLADGDTEFWIKEVGFLLADGTMLAVWSNNQPLAHKSKNVPLLLAFDFSLTALPANSVTVQGTNANLSLAGWGEQYAALSSASIDNMARHVKMLLRVNELESKQAT